MLLQPLAVVVLVDVLVVVVTPGCGAG